MFLSNLSGFKGTTCPPGQRSVRQYPPLRSAQVPQKDSPTFQGVLKASMEVEATRLACNEAAVYGRPRRGCQCLKGVWPDFESEPRTTMRATQPAIGIQNSFPTNRRLIPPSLQVFSNPKPAISCTPFGSVASRPSVKTRTRQLTNATEWKPMRSGL